MLRRPPGRERRANRRQAAGHDRGFNFQAKADPCDRIPTRDDPAEEAYDAGYQLWRTGKYDAAIGALRAFRSSYPNHRRTSWANNLAGRAMLDKGEPRAAAEVLLANYRGNPKGERAADSLFYLGQSLMKLDQPAQACKAYSELEAVYGSTMRADLQKLFRKRKRRRSAADDPRGSNMVPDVAPSNVSAPISMR